MSKNKYMCISNIGSKNIHNEIIPAAGRGGECLRGETGWKTKNKFFNDKHENK